MRFGGGGVGGVNTDLVMPVLGADGGIDPRRPRSPAAAPRASEDDADDDDFDPQSLLVDHEVLRQRGY